MSLRYGERTPPPPAPKPESDNTGTRVAVVVIIIIIVILIILLLVWVFTRPTKSKNSYTNCLSNADCPSGQLCNGNGQCVNALKDNDGRGGHGSDSDHHDKHSKGCKCGVCIKERIDIEIDVEYDMRVKKKCDCGQCDQCRGRGGHDGWKNRGPPLSCGGCGKCDECQHHPRPLPHPDCGGCGHCDRCKDHRPHDDCPCDDCMFEGEEGHGHGCGCDPCKRKKRNWGPKICTCEPDAPTNVTVTFNMMLGTATITWSPVPEAKKYIVYRKFLDPTVGKNNYDEKIVTTATTVTFVNLTAGGAHYFVVSACNECGQSDESYPTVLAPICTALPAQPDPPVVVQQANLCSGPQPAEIVDVFFSNDLLTNGGYILQGNGQIGSVSNYFYLIEGSLFGPATNITPKCAGLPNSHPVTNIISWTMANLNIPPPPPLTGNTFQMKWFPVAGAEEYAVWFVAADVGHVYFYGGFAPGTSNILNIATQAGLIPVFALVVGYKLCDKSPPSTIATHTTPNGGALQCEVDEDCPVLTSCVQGLCVPEVIQCTGNAGCPPGTQCLSGVCVPLLPECLNDSQCPPNMVCFDGACIPNL